MAKVLTDSQHYTDIAAAIREKNGTETTYKPSEMAEAIQGIQSGGSGGDLDAFIDGSLTEITSNVEKVADYAFYYSQMTKVSLPNAKEIGDKAFQYCSRLASLNIPQVEELGIGAFANSNGFTELNCPSVTTLHGSDTCLSCAYLEVANFPALSKTMNAMFKNCKRFTKLNAPNLTLIDRDTFRSCTSLTESGFPLVTSIGLDAYNECTALQRVDFPAVTTMAQRCFYGCTVLTTVILRSPTVCTLSNINVFTSTPIADGTGYIYVPDDLVESYKVATNWSTYASQIKGLSELEGAA